MSTLLIREVRRLEGALLTFILSGPLALAHLVLSSTARGGFDERTAIESGILLGSGYLGYKLTKGFIHSISWLCEHALTTEERELIASAEDREIPTGFYVSALCLFASFTYFGAAALILVLQPDFGAAAIGWIVLGIVLFAVWIGWVVWPDEPSTAQKVEAERRVVANARAIPGRLWEPA
jgi:hypothetical protein